MRYQTNWHFDSQWERKDTLKLDYYSRENITNFIIVNSTAFIVEVATELR